MVGSVPVPVVDAETGADGMLKPFRSDGVLLSLGPMQDLLHGWDLGDHIVHCLGLSRIALFDALKREVWLSGHTVVEDPAGA